MWYTNAFFASIAGAVVGAVLSAAVSAVIFIKSRRRMHLDCIIETPKSLLTVSDKVKEKIDIKYSNNKVTSVYLFSIEVHCSGNKAIENQPILIQLDNDARIIDYSVATEPAQDFGTIVEGRPSESSIRLVANLLNPGDRLDIEIVSIQNSSGIIDVFLKNKDVGTRIVRRNRDRTVIIEGSMAERLAASVVAVMVQSLAGTPLKVTYQDGSSKGDKVRRR